MERSALGGPACAEDPGIFGASLRLRSGLFRAHIQFGAHQDWKVHNRQAFALLAEIVDFDLRLLRPAAPIGWGVDDCRLAVQDCMDAFDFAEDWFRGWAPDYLIESCDVPPEQAHQIEKRIEERVALLGERMLALRAWQDAIIVPEVVPRWVNLWSTLSKDIERKFQIGAHPGTRAYFQELARAFTKEVIDQLATALCDGAIEGLKTTYREELFFNLPAFRLRCILRCYLSPGSKRESFASARGTVLEDLQGPGSHNADLNILYSLFTHPAEDMKEWQYGLYMNIMPSNDNEENLPRILRNPFMLGEMLSESEWQVFSSREGLEIYEEL